MGDDAEANPAAHVGLDGGDAPLDAADGAGATDGSVAEEEEAVPKAARGKRKRAKAARRGASQSKRQRVPPAIGADGFTQQQRRRMQQATESIRAGAEAAASAFKEAGVCQQEARRRCSALTAEVVCGAVEAVFNWPSPAAH